MKRFLQLVMLAAALIGNQSANAFTYADGDLLLIFRQDGRSDVEFNLGPVTNYLRLSSGTVINVTNFDSALVKSSFSLASAKFILMAATNAQAAVKFAYVSDGDASSAPTDNKTVSGWKVLQSKIYNVGLLAAVNTSSNSVQTYQISATDASSYTYNATDGLGTGNQDVTTIAGDAPFQVENSIPGISRFFIVRGVNPPSGLPSTQLGSFSVGTNASGFPILTYTAGVSVTLPPPTPVILSITRIGSTATVMFTSTNGANYQLHYTGSSGLNTPASNWLTLPPIMASGPTTILQDTSAPATNRFYKVEAFH